MKIRVWCGVGRCKKEQTIYLLRDWRITDEEWAEMSEEEHIEWVGEWASNYMEYGYEELDD